MKETLSNSLAATALMAGAAIGMRTMENPIAHAANLISQPMTHHLSLTQQEINHIKGEDEVRKDIAATFIISAGVLAVSLFAYRMSDGTRTKAEKYAWMIGVPATFTVGAGMLLALMWQDKVL